MAGDWGVAIWNALLWLASSALMAYAFLHFCKQEQSQPAATNNFNEPKSILETSQLLSTQKPSKNRSSQTTLQIENRGSRAFKDRNESHLILEATFGLPRQVAIAAGSLVDLATRDFVLSWYKNTSPDMEFLDDARLIMLDIVGGFICRISKLDFAAFLVKDVAPILRRNVANFHKFHKIASLRNPTLFTRRRPETVRIFKEREQELLDAGLVLHQGATDNGAHAQATTMRVLRALLASSDINCLALVHLIREIIVRSIVLPALDSLHPFCLNSGLVSASTSASSSSSNGTTSANESHDGRIVETLKAGKELLNHSLEEMDEESTVSVSEPLDQAALEENHFAVRESLASTDTDSEFESDTDFTLTSIRVTKPDLSLDYTDPSDPVPFMSYSVEVKATASRTKRAVAWVEKTRYSKLKDLHARLHRRFPTMTAIFPKNRGWKKYLLGLPDYDKTFVDARTRDLNEYMNSLLRDPYIRESRILKKFLLGDHGRLGTLTAEASTTQPPSQESSMLLFPAIEQSSLAAMDLQELYSLIEEIFLLDHGRFSFFRSNIISFVRIIVKTAFKGSLFKYLSSISERKTETISDIIIAIREGTWPKGELAPPPVIPDENVQMEVQEKALQYLKSALPAQVVSLIGAEHRDLIAQNSHELLQYHMVSKSIFMEIADVLIAKLFPDTVEE